MIPRNGFNKAEDGRVINGTNAIPGQYPFMVSIKKKPGPHFCGGSFIHPYWILTAAHCLDNIAINNMEIQYGLTDRWEEPLGVATVQKAIKHPNYSRENYWENDIAMLKLPKRVFYVAGIVEKIKLPSIGFEVQADNMKGILIGWGLNATGGFMQNNLQEANLTIHTDKDCFKLQNGRTTTKQICCSSPNGGNKECKGDSGGPLIYYDSNNIKIQVGIVSWGHEPCGQTQYPGVYTKVSHYIDWINQNLK